MTRWAITALLAVLPPLVAMQPQGCSRRADIRDEPDSSFVAPPPEIDAGEILPVDAGLDAYPPCGERPFALCYGTVDFPCGFSSWIVSLAERCQEETGCKTNGHLEVTLGEDGCVAEIAMNQPNDDIVACLAEEIGSTSCPCERPETVSHFFGLGNDGCGSDCSIEFPCPEGERCVAGECVR